jgi:hypothetical protein
MPKSRNVVALISELAATQVANSCAPSDFTRNGIKASVVAICTILANPAASEPERCRDLRANKTYSVIFGQKLATRAGGQGRS